MYMVETPRKRQTSLAWPEYANHRFFGSGDIEVSFEFLPPKTAAMEKTLWYSIKRLEALTPTHVAITDEGRESAREHTRATVERILKETRLNVAAHLTCISATREEVDEIIRAYWEIGVRRLVAVRGDAPNGEFYKPYPGGYVNSVDLVAGIKAIAPFEVIVAAYPEKHPDSPSVEADLDMLKAKIDAGATRAITQCFFDNERFFRFLDRVRAAGITIPITPGILPIYDFTRILGFASKASVTVPDRLIRRVKNLDDDEDTRCIAAVASAAEQVLNLVDHGISEFHFYTLNHADIIFALCHILGLRARDWIGRPT